MNFFIFILSFIFFSSAIAAEKILKSEKLSESIFDGEKELKFSLRTEAKELLYDFSEGRPYYATKMVASLEAASPNELKEYGIVQFIRGCVFNSKLRTDGTVRRSISTVRDFFNENFLFKHPEWVLDSVDIDPLYWSSADPNVGRIGLYRLDNLMINQGPGDQRFLHKHHEQQKKYFVRDMPSGATEYYGEHQNVSLEFKTCVYRIADVPVSSDPAATGLIGKELKCFDWRSNFIYDYSKNLFQIESEMHPYCVTTGN